MKEKRHRGFKIFLIVLGIIFAFIGLGMIVFSPYLNSVMELRRNALAIAKASKADDFCTAQTSFVYDVNGELFTTINGSQDIRYVEGKYIPEILNEAFIVLEDRKFYSHSGVDYLAMLRSAIENMKNEHIVQGASTITQQLARNIYLTQDVNYERKITEIFLAQALEKKYSKSKILEFYINNIYFGNGYYGIGAASAGYFNKDVGDLSLSQLAFLAAIPNNPSKYDPVSHYDNTLERRNLVLRLLHDEKLISDIDYELALDEKITLDRVSKTKNNYVDTYVRYCATRALMREGGFSFRYEFVNDDDRESYNELYEYYYNNCQTMLFNKGYKIYTSIDLDKQEQLQKAVDDALASHTETNEEGVYALQASAVCIDNSNGFVSAIVGGREQDFLGYTLNRAYQSYRQSGSAIKPLIAYAPYLMLGHNPDDKVDDTYFAGGPGNSNDYYLGETTLQEALAVSSNVVTWKIYEELTPVRGMSFLKKMNFKKVAVDEKLMSACLGGFTYGVSSEEMAAGFATLANDGVYREPTCIVVMSLPKTGVVIDNNDRGYNVYDKDASRMISHMLKYGVEHGIATGAALDDAIVAVKTGTTSSNKDGWTVGYSMYYTTAVWVGYDIPKSSPEITGGTYPMTIWKNYMERIHQGLDMLDFPAYENYREKNSEMTVEEYREYDSQNNQNSDTGVQSFSGGDKDAPTISDKDANINGVGDQNADTNNRGDQNADVSVGGDQKASTDSRGNQNADVSVGGDQKASTDSRGDQNADLNDSGDQNADISGHGDTNAGAQANVGGDQNADTSLMGDRDAQ